MLNAIFSATSGKINQNDTKLIQRNSRNEWPRLYCLFIDLCHSGSFANSFGIKRPDEILVTWTDKKGKEKLFL